MSTRFRPYSAYRHSEVQWVGRIPEHWQVKRLKFLASQPLAYGANESAELNDPSQPRFIRITDIKSDGSLHEDTFRSLPEAVAEPFLLKDGDLLLARSGATVGKTFMYRESWGRACHAGYLIRCRLNPKAANPQFISYFATSSAYWGWLSSVFIQATIQNVSAEKYACLSVPVPSVGEQERIASFLDRETEKIDALVAKKERLIELLQENRTALISHAVTQGLNPDVPKKDSGTPWIGQIPSHWEIKRLSTVCGFEQGKAHEPFVDEAGEFICVNSRFVSTEGATVKFCRVNLTPARHHDILMVMSDLPNGRALAKAYFVHDGRKYAVNQRVCRLTAHTAHPRFLFYQLDRNEFFLQHDDGVNQTHLYNGLFTRFPALIPPLDEQKAIAEFLDQETTKLDVLTTKVRTAIERLQEYRTALISAAVTGQIDVRNGTA